MSALLSQVLVAFTIEFDNEFERQMPHRTTIAKSAAAAGRRAPWLVSLAMWSNYLRFVDEGGVSVREFARRAGLPRPEAQLWLERLSKWWGYVVIAPDPADERTQPARADWVVRPSAAGRRARDVWRPLFATIEQRWEARFGVAEIAELRASLRAVVGQLDLRLPRYLPVLGYGLRTIIPAEILAAPDHDVAGFDLSALISKVLLAFTVEFERESEISLAICANVLRVLTEHGVRVRDLPSLTGVSKEAVGVSVRFLERRGDVAAATDPAATGARLIRVSPSGRRAQEEYWRLVAAIEERWEARFGAAQIRGLRDALHELLERRDGTQSRMSAGLQPYPTGWRARKPYLTQTIAVTRDPGGALPHYPTVLHRGGWPDGS